MSRAFVKEDSFVEELPERPVSDEPNDVTPRGFQMIIEATDRARRELASAQAADDRAAVAKASRDLRYWSSRLSSARVVGAPADSGRVQFGATVTILRDDGRQQTYQIVGEDEADPTRGTISHVSPLARSMFGKLVGEVFQAGSGEAEILEVR